MTDSTVDRLLDLTASISFDRLPDRVKRAALRVVVDSIGCALGGLNQPEVVALRQLGASSPGKARVWGTTVTTSVDLAALTNGVMIRCLDFNDDYFGGSGDMGPHPSDVIGSLVAAVESRGAGGADLLEAVVIAYEVIGRLVDELKQRPGRAWDYTFVHAAGTALASGRILGLDRRQLANALGISVVSSVGLYQARTGELSNWKAFAGPHASRNGLLAAQLAAVGITGPSEPFAGRAGLSTLLGLDLAVAPGAREDFTVERAFFKSLPVRYTNQLPVTIAIDSHREIDLETVDEIVVYGIGRDAVDRRSRPELWRPDSRETADHALPYLVASALVRGSVGPETFERKQFTDPGVLRIADRIRLAEDPDYTRAFPTTQRARLEVTSSRGGRKVFEQANPKGHPGNPMTDDELEAKFLALCGRHLSSARARCLLDRLWQLEGQVRLGDVWAMMEPSETGSV